MVYNNKIACGGESISEKCNLFVRSSYATRGLLQQVIQLVGCFIAPNTASTLSFAVAKNTSECRLALSAQQIRNDIVSMPAAQCLFNPIQLENAQQRKQTGQFELCHGEVYRLPAERRFAPALASPAHRSNVLDLISGMHLRCGIRPAGSTCTNYLYSVCALCPRSKNQIRPRVVFSVRALGAETFAKSSNEVEIKGCFWANCTLT